MSLLKHGADPNLANKQGCTALHYAALSGNKIILQSLLENEKTVVNATDMRKVNPLFNACSLGHEEVRSNTCLLPHLLRILASVWLLGCVMASEIDTVIRELHLLKKTRESAENVLKVRQSSATFGNV